MGPSFAPSFSWPRAPPPPRLPLPRRARWRIRAGGREISHCRFVAAVRSPSLSDMREDRSGFGKDRKSGIHSHTLTHAHSHTHTLTHALSLPLTHTHTLTPPTDAHTHTTRTHTHTHTHSHTHPRAWPRLSNGDEWQFFLGCVFFFLLICSYPITSPFLPTFSCCFFLLPDNTSY